MLRDRLISSAVLIICSLGLLWLDAVYPAWGLAGVWLMPLMWFFALGTAFDLANMLRSHGQPVSRRWILIPTGLVTLAPCVPQLWPIFGHTYPADCPLGQMGWVVVGLLAALAVVLVREIACYDGERTGALTRTLAGIFASLYIGLPMALFVLIRQLNGGGNPGGSQTWGLAAILAFIAITKSCDAGAYFTGKAIGRRKLIPALSPGKTYEGAVGGILTSVAVSYACWLGVVPAISEVAVPPPWWGPLVFGIICAVSGMIGDLAESLVKRETGVKDSGSWLPGLGGVWDVTDSLIGAVGPAWLMLIAGLAGS